MVPGLVVTVGAQFWPSEPAAIDELIVDEEMCGHRTSTYWVPMVAPVTAVTVGSIAPLV